MCILWDTEYSCKLPMHQRRTYINKSGLKKTPLNDLQIKSLILKGFICYQPKNKTCNPLILNKKIVGFWEWPTLSTNASRVIMSYPQIC